MKKNAILGFLVILLVFGFFGCDNGNNDPKVYTVNIGTLINGSLSANPTSGIEGTEITLTVSPDSLYRLKVNTLKYGLTNINETTYKFYLPSEDIIVTAEFELLFIGTWLLDIQNDLFTFFENTFTQQRNSDGKYICKGDWKIENQNILKLFYTHRNSSGVTTAEDLIEEFSFESIIEFEFLSNKTSFKVIGEEFYFTLVQ